MNDIETLRQEVADLRKALAGVQGVQLIQPVNIALTTLCPKDPNRDKILEAGGVVMPEDGPTHLGGFITDIRNVAKKHRTMGPDGRQIEFEAIHQTATWICATDGSEIKLDPYVV